MLVHHRLQLVLAHAPSCSRPVCGLVGLVLVRRPFCRPAGACIRSVASRISCISSCDLGSSRRRCGSPRPAGPARVQAFEGVGEVALLELHREIPQLLGHLVRGSAVRPRGRTASSCADQHAQAQIGVFVADEAVRARRRRRAAPARRARAFAARPHQVAALSIRAAASGSKEAAAGQGHGRSGVATGRSGRRRRSRRSVHRDRQVGQRMLGQILDQRLVELGAVAAESASAGRARSARAVRGRRPGRSGGRPRPGRGRSSPCRFDHAVIVGGGERLVHLAHRPRASTAPVGDGLGRLVGQDVISHSRAARPVDRERPLVVTVKSCCGSDAGGFVGAARHGLGHGQRADLAIKPQTDRGCRAAGQRAAADVVEVERGLAGIGGRLAQPSQTGPVASAARRRRRAISATEATRQTEPKSSADHQEQSAPCSAAP